MFCSKCGTEVNNLDASFCPKCGISFNSHPELELSPMQRKILLVSAGQKYPVLRWIAVIYKVCAILIAAFGIISSVGSCIPLPAYGMFAGHMMLIGMAIFIGSIFGAINLWAIGEGIMVFLDIEENLRKLVDKA